MVAWLENSTKRFSAIMPVSGRTSASPVLTTFSFQVSYRDFGHKVIRLQIIAVSLYHFYADFSMIIDGVVPGHEPQLESSLSC